MVTEGRDQVGLLLVRVACSCQSGKLQAEMHCDQLMPAAPDSIQLLGWKAVLLALSISCSMKGLPPNGCSLFVWSSLLEAVLQHWATAPSMWKRFLPSSLSSVAMCTLVMVALVSMAKATAEDPKPAPYWVRASALSEVAKVPAMAPVPILPEP